MSDQSQDHESKRADQFARQSEQPETGLLREYIDFLQHSKKWWLIPIFVGLVLLGGLVLLSNTAAAPFIYALF